MSLQLSSEMYPCRAIGHTGVTGFKMWRGSVVYGSLQIYYFISQPPKSSLCMCVCVYTCMCAGRLNVWPEIPWSSPYLWTGGFDWFVLWVIWCWPTLLYTYCICTAAHTCMAPANSLVGNIHGHWYMWMWIKHVHLLDTVQEHSFSFFFLAMAVCHLWLVKLASDAHEL